MAALSDRPQVAIRRASSGRWIAGVCAGMATFRRVPVALVRAGFLAAVLLGGLGVFVYLACWLIVPAAADPARAGSAAGVGAPDGAAAEPAGIVYLARVIGACAGLLGLAAGSALVSVFGLGWIALVVAAVALVAMYVPLTRISATLGLTSIVALALPSLAVSAASISLVPEFSPVVARPTTASALAGATYRSGLGTMFLDLRRTQLPNSGTIDVHIRAGIRRTIVALPHDQCVHVQIRYDVHPFDANMATLLSGRSTEPSTGLVLFNRIWATERDSFAIGPTGGATPGPTLDIDFSSEGGSLQVRDYPNSVDPRTDPDWPGLSEPIDPRPMRLGATKHGYARELAYWHRRVAEERTWQHELETQLPGPCGR